MSTAGNNIYGIRLVVIFSRNVYVSLLHVTQWARRDGQLVPFRWYISPLHTVQRLVGIPN